LAIYGVHARDRDALSGELEMLILLVLKIMLKR
jgi:hypothetical protein